MVMLPTPNQVAGRHLQLFEAYYKELDPQGSDSIGAITAAKFLKNSGLPDALLSKIWDLSDPNGTGSLSKSGLFVSLKLIALAQNNVDVSMGNIDKDVPPPMMGDATVFPPNIPTAPSPLPVISSIPVVPVDWSMTPMERLKYEQLFESLQPKNGFIPGNKVKGVLMDSKLPTDTLGKIWDLADMDKDGCLDKHEFIVAMHLVYKALEKFAIPSTLPKELLPPSKRKLVADQNNHPSMVPPPIPPAPSPIPWVVSKEDKDRYDVMFKKADIDQDGYVSGPEIKHVFLSCNLSQPILAQIWGLADINQIGKLTSEQFALAMWLVQYKLKGNELPSSLSQEMIPPSLRSSNITGVSTAIPPVVAQQPPPPPSNPEIDMILKDIEELSNEKFNLQNEISQREADVIIKNGQVKSLQSEVEALAATLGQLENQKVEAAKRLAQLKSQSTAIESELNDVDMEIQAEQVQVDKIRTQANEQESVLSKQESELSSKKAELDSLKHEEMDLEKKQKEINKQLNKLSTQLQETQLLISQINSKTSDMKEYLRQLNDFVSLSEEALSKNDVSMISDSYLNIEAEFKSESILKLLHDQDHNKQNGIQTGNTIQSEQTNGFNDPFASSDGFANDPFASTNGTAQPNDPFAATFGNSKSNSDPFAETADHPPATESRHGSKDPFGCDPFSSGGGSTLGSSHGHPPPRPESPSPALPPKKSKQPPPRPAPPRPVQPIQPHSQSSTNNMEFADFDNFNNKVASTRISSPFSTTNSVSSKSNSRNSSIKSPINNISISNICSSPTLTLTSRSAGSGSAGKLNKSQSIVDFTDDPFKDYRYEDPFNIIDPFSDSNDDDFINNKTNTKSNSNNSLPIRTKPDGSPCHFDPFDEKNIEKNNFNISNTIVDTMFKNDPFFSNTNNNNTNNTNNISDPFSSINNTNNHTEKINNNYTENINKLNNTDLFGTDNFSNFFNNVNNFNNNSTEINNSLRNNNNNIIDPFSFSSTSNNNNNNNNKNIFNDSWDIPTSETSLTSSNIISSMNTIKLSSPFSSSNNNKIKTKKQQEEEDLQLALKLSKELNSENKW